MPIAYYSLQLHRLCNIKYMDDYDDELENTLRKHPWHVTEKLRKTTKKPQSAQTRF